MTTSLHRVKRAAPTRRRSPSRAPWLWVVVFLAPAVVSLVFLRVAPTIGAIGSSLYKAFPGGLVPATFTGLG
ncbi:MAG TPA: hypothetical protein VHB92_08975, partial [Humibacter sp.]|nr:hypothetical protein [Humibacter sp.]